jgi:hypothetical protein
MATLAVKEEASRVWRVRGSRWAHWKLGFWCKERHIFWLLRFDPLTVRVWHVHAVAWVNVKRTGHPSKEIILTSPALHSTYPKADLTFHHQPLWSFRWILALGVRPPVKYCTTSTTSRVTRKKRLVFHFNQKRVRSTTNTGGEPSRRVRDHFNRNNTY